MHRYVLHNGEVQDAHAPSVSPGQVGFMNGWGVFSTLRVAEGVLFAYERHWARMQRDAVRMHVPFPADPEWLRSHLHRLIDVNSAFDATLRVVIVRNHGGAYEGPGLDRDFDLIAFTTGLTDWGSSVRLGIKPHARHAQCEFAGAKIMSWALNLVWYEEAHQRGFDEYILLNERGEVSECTSANIFALFGGHLYTPPLSSGCLAGITRELLLEELRVPGLVIAEKTLSPSDLERADQVLITSSTRDVVSVREIDSLRIQSQGETATILRSAFVSYRKYYLATHARPSKVLSE
ncbi:MAG TPA: aminotransferase class IV [Bryobacteraceae bacterium]|nr:aminotransferase class IV [Bryobacteraceae bacterium]